MKKRLVILFLFFISYFHPLWAKNIVLPVVTVTADMDKKSASTSHSSEKKIDNSTNSYGNESIEVGKKSGMSTQQLLSQLSGVSITGGPLAINQAPNVRGLSGNQLNISIDGVSNSFRGFGHNNIRLLPGSELLKAITIDSPTDSLYGSGNMGGTVEFTTLDPQDYLCPDEKIGAELSQELQTGAPGFKSTMAVFGRWGNVSALFKIIGDRFLDIHLGNGQNLPYSAQNNLQYLGKVVITPDAYQTVKFSILSLQNVGTYSSIFNISSAKLLGDFNLLQQQQLLDYSFKPGNPYIDFKVKLYHLDTNQTLTPLEESQGVLPQAINIETTGLFLRNISKLGDNHLTYGMETTYQNGKDLYSGTTGNFPRAHATQYAGFLRDKLDLNSRLQTILGLRFDTRQSSNGALYNQTSHLGKELGLNYQVTPNFSVYTKYAEGFRYPTLDELYLGGPHPGSIPVTILPNPDLQLESNANKEFGWQIKKLNILQAGDKFTLRNSIFLNDIHNYIALIPVKSETPGIYLFQNQNIGNARLYGYTVSTRYQQRNNFALYAAAGYTHGYNTTPYPGFFRGPIVIPAGTALPSVPPFQGNIGMIVPVRQMQEMQFQINFSSRQNEVPGVSSAIGGYTTFDLYYRWHLPSATGLDVIAFAENITNKYYAVYSGIPSVEPGGVTTPLAAMGRNLGLTVSYRF